MVCRQNIDFDFNSLKTSQIKGHLTKFGIPAFQSLQVIKPHDASYSEATNWIQAFTSYETDVGRGKGYIRLRESAPGRGDWKAYTFFVSRGTVAWSGMRADSETGCRRLSGK